MADPFVAEIRIFPFNFPPRGWAFCNGQLLPISQNTALFSLLGTTYGGDGKSTFALPNMLDNVPMQPGQGSGLSLRDLGEMSGVETITLLQSEIPVHTHSVQALPAASQQPTASPNTMANGAWVQGNQFGVVQQYTTNMGAPTVMMGFQAVGLAGGGLPHNNMQPYLTLNFCIAPQGIFPQRP
jgi:microcystin-dependent protein